MAIIVKRFKVRHNGKLYGPGQPNGQIITGLSEEEETHLINNSNGTIEKYDPEALIQHEPKESNENDNAGQEKGEAALEEGNEENSEFNINPDDFIKPGKS